MNVETNKRVQISLSAEEASLLKLVLNKYYAPIAGSLADDPRNELTGMFRDSLWKKLDQQGVNSYGGE